MAPALLLAGVLMAGCGSGPSRSYVDGYHYVVAHRGAQQGGNPAYGPAHVTRTRAGSSCAVWSFPNTGDVPRGDVAREWREGCEAALIGRAERTAADRPR